MTLGILALELDRQPEGDAERRLRSKGDVGLGDMRGPKGGEPGVARGGGADTTPMGRSLLFGDRKG